MALRNLIDIGTKLAGLEVVNRGKCEQRNRRAKRRQQRQRQARPESNSLRFNYGEAVRIYSEQQAAIDSVYTQAGLVLTVATAVAGIGLSELARRAGERARSRPPSIWEQILMARGGGDDIPWWLMSEILMGGLALLYLVFLGLLIRGILPETLWSTPDPVPLMDYVDSPEEVTMAQTYQIMVNTCEFNRKAIETRRKRVYYGAAPMLPVIVVYLAVALTVAR